jgi:5-methylcytosine-specific restriction endonuclease McrA
MSFSDAGKLGNKRSQVTHQKAKQKRKELYELYPLRCRQCNDIFPYEVLVKRKKDQRKFCSKSCAAIHNNPPQKKSCELCGSSTSNPRFCSRICYVRCRNNLVQQKFESGELKTITIRKKLVALYGYRCMATDCAWDFAKKHTVIEIDHIDGDPENNHPSNLRLLCPNCHSQTATYKGKNVGSGRFVRRERYRQGKSY